MAAGSVELPEGFVLDGAPSAPVPGLPDGFVMDPPMGALRAAGRGMWQGAMMGAGDEITAAAEASPLPGADAVRKFYAAGKPGELTSSSIPNPVDAIAGGARVLGEKLGLIGGDAGGQAYDKKLAQERALDAQASADQPVANIAGNVGGAILNPVNLAGMGGGFKAGAAAGGATGAIYGFNSGEGGLENRLGGAAVGGALGGAVGGVTNAALNKLAPAVPGQATPLVSALEQEGITAPVALTGDKLARSAANVTRQVPFVGQPIQDAVAATQGQLDARVRDLAQSVGSGAAEDAGGAIREGVTRYVKDDLPASTSKMYERAQRHIDPDMLHDLPNTQKVVDSILERNANAKIGDSKAAALVQDALEATKPPPPQIAKPQSPPRISTDGGSAVPLDPNAMNPKVRAQLEAQGVLQRGPEDVPAGLFQKAPGESAPASPIAAPEATAGKSKGPKPQTLAQFIARSGGLEMTADTQPLQRFIPGAGMLVRKNGKSVDGHWREALQEAGYLPKEADGYMSRDIRGELFDALEAEHKHGKATYSAADQTRIPELNGGKLSGLDHEIEAEAVGLRNELAKAGVDPKGVDTSALYDAAEALFYGHEKDPFHAYERAVMMRALQDDALGAHARQIGDVSHAMDGGAARGNGPALRTGSQLGEEARPQGGAIGSGERVPELGKGGTGGPSAEAAQGVAAIPASAGPKVGMNFQGIQDLRSSIGEKLSNKLSIAGTGIDGKQLKAIYGALTEDLKSAAKKAGGDEGLAAWEKANQFAELSFKQRGQLAKIIGPEGAKSDEAVFGTVNRLASNMNDGANATALLKIRRALGDDWDHVTSAAIYRIGRATPEAEFSPARFVTQWNKISLRGKDIVFGPQGSELRQSLDRISTISQEINNRITKFTNTSNTGPLVMGAALLAKLPTHPIQTIGKVLGGVLFARALAQPATAKALARYTTAYNAALSAPRGGLNMINQSARQLGSTLQKEFGIKIDPQALISGPLSSRALDQNEAENQ